MSGLPRSLLVATTLVVCLLAYVHSLHRLQSVPERSTSTAVPPVAQAKGELELGPDGRFLPGRGTIRLFEQHLAATDELPAIRVRVHNAARDRLPADDVPRAMLLFDRFLDYRASLPARLEPIRPADARAAVAAVKRAQVEWFGAADAERLFGADNALADLVLAQR